MDNGYEKDEWAEQIFTLVPAGGGSRFCAAPQTLAIDGEKPFQSYFVIEIDY
jgi:hypothetical protein